MVFEAIESERSKLEVLKGEMEEFLEESNGLPVNETTGNWYRLGMSAIMTEAQLKRHLKVCLNPDESTPEGYIN